MKISSESKLFLGIVIATIAIIGIAIMFFSQPAKALTKEALIPAGAHTSGNASASSWLVEFSDFECPACGEFEPAVEQLIKNDSDKLLFAYRNFPLSQHKNGMPAARAAEAAALQNKYWEMHSLLFANQTRLTDGLYLDLAKQLNLDESKFQADLKNPAVQAKIDSDVNYGNSIGINATPTFFLNGLQISPNSPDDLIKIVTSSFK